jgi:Fe-S-cluster-containing hydrogenase component 2
MAAKRLPPPKVPAESIRKLEIFNGVPKAAMDAFIAKCEGVVLARDEMVTKPEARNPDPYLNFVVAGQVGCGEFTPEAGKAEGMAKKKEIFKKVGQTLAVFAYGDFFADNFGADADLCLYAIVETQVVRVKQSEAEAVLNAHPKLRDKLRLHAEKWLTRIRYLREGGRDEVFDFYVKNGFSFSTRTKIRQLELCIDCDKCVQGCEERHGFSRIERFGPQVGLINFSITCRQCYDPRCLIDCNFDAIARDPASHEIRIDIERCTGCSVCARSCPNDSIFVHELHDGLDLSLWDDLGKKPPKKVAQKCDRCAGYDDMACISACPTGSMVDALPEVIFGLEHGQTIDESCSTEPFERGWSFKATPRVLPKLLYGMAALLTGASILEWVTRRWAPDFSFIPVFTSEIAKGEAFNPGRGFGLFLGIVGALCMIGTLPYVFRNRFESGFDKIAQNNTVARVAFSKYMWFSIHNALGALGPALVFLHGNLNFKEWPSVGVWSMILVVVSGFLGQYLANQLPGKQYRNTREQAELDRGLMALSKDWGEHTRAINVAELMMQNKPQKAGPTGENMGTLRFLFFLFTDDIRRQMHLLKMRFGELSKIKNKALRRQLMDIRKQQLTLERQDRFYRTTGQLMSQWKLFHIFFSIGLFLLMFLHVAVEVAYKGMGLIESLL